METGLPDMLLTAVNEWEPDVGPANP